MSAPKVFISYSWSNHEHELKVIKLATELRESGADVMLDKWDLKEGHDAIAFMEQMVTNEDIKKVIIVCDKLYAEKADDRSGGVGTETQIISKEVYDKQAQNKFVAVVTEKDEEGQPCLPTYYKSRIFIDLSEMGAYADNFEKLLRWIFDKPLYIKPGLGTPPEFLSEGVHISLGTSVMFRRCLDAIRSDKSYAHGAFDEYCNTLAENLERFRLVNVEGEFDDAVVSNIEQFLPFRNEAVQLVGAMAQYGTSKNYIQSIHRMFEKLLNYKYRPASVTQCKKWDFDNFKFIVHELFLYVLAVLVKYERFEDAGVLLASRYYDKRRADDGREPMVTFTAFREYLESLEHRNGRLKLNRLSVQSDLLHSRSKASKLDYKYIMQADFICFVRADLHLTETHDRWFPDTLLYLESEVPFETFARSMSNAYFNQMKVLLGIEKPADLTPLFEQYGRGQLRVPSWQFESINPHRLIGLSKLATID